MRPESSRRGIPCRIAIRSRLSSRTGYNIQAERFRIRPQLARMRWASQTHIGEYDAKTNAVGRLRQAPERIRSRRRWVTIERERARYCPWVFSTVSHAEEILGRFCCRHARMVKSP